MAKNKQRLKKIMISRIWLTVFAVIVFVLLWNSISLFAKRVKVWKKVEHLETERATLLAHKQVIEEKTASLETDFGKEAVFRERFNVARPGEAVIIVTESEETSGVVEAKNGFWDFFRQLFK